ncbi:MAG: hypothetical protein AB1649_15310 [Chloroflexota bacterium]
MAEESKHEGKFKREIPEEAREHFRKARDEMRSAIEKLLPEGFIEHRHAARREMLMAWRSLLDAAIKRIDEKQ